MAHELQTASAGVEPEETLGWAKPTIRLLFDDPVGYLGGRIAFEAPRNFDGLVDGVQELELDLVERIVEAPEYVVPARFAATWDDIDKFPTIVTLKVKVYPWNGPIVSRVVLEPRIHDGFAHDWLDSPYEYVGAQPQLPVPSLLREALAHAAMRLDNVSIGEMGKHVDAVLAAVPVKREPRVSRWDRNKIRFLYQEARAIPTLTTRLEREMYVFAQLHEWSPVAWPLHDGRQPEHKRLRPYLDALDRELDG